MTEPFAQQEIWFLTGSQHLYGPKALEQVAKNSSALVEMLNKSKHLPIKLVFKPVLTTPEEIRRHLHRRQQHGELRGRNFVDAHVLALQDVDFGFALADQAHFAFAHAVWRDLPWETIDMDFMNLNQSAHGDREAGFIHTRLRLNRKVVVGHLSDPAVHERIDAWSRAASAWADWQGGSFARFGDNMRYVAVTDGDKVSAEAKFGFSVNGYGVGDLVKHVNEVSDQAISMLCQEYEECYSVAAELRRGGARHESLRDGARIELGLRSFLTGGNFKGFTTTFEDLHGLKQLPGLAVQRLMSDGYGFGAEGDWKTCALVRAVKIMSAGLPGGTSFMEDYTYHLEPDNMLVLGAHMLEICDSIAESKPSLEIHPLGIGGKADPVRLVFNAHAGAALNASLVDLGNRFRLLVNEVDVIAPPKPLPKLPVARAVWKCKPDFKTACAAWIYSGGAHHTAFSYSTTQEHLQDFADIAGIEMVPIDARTNLADFKQMLRNNEVYYHLAPGLAGL